MCVSGTTTLSNIPLQKKSREQKCAPSKKRRLPTTTTAPKAAASNDRKRSVHFVGGTDDDLTITTTTYSIPSLSEVIGLKDTLWYTTCKLNSLFEQELQRNHMYKSFLQRGNNSDNDHDDYKINHNSVVADWLSLSWRGLEWHLQDCGMQVRRAHVRSHVHVILAEYRRDPTSADNLSFVSESLSEDDRQKAHQRGLQDASASACALIRKTKSNNNNAVATISPSSATTATTHFVLYWWLRFMMIFLIYGVLLKST